MSKPFQRNLKLGFGVSLALLLASSIASYTSIKDQLNNRAKVDQSMHAIASANFVLHNLQNAETGQRGYHLTGKDDFLTPYLNSLLLLPQSLDSMQALVVDHPTQSQMADTISSLVQSRLAILTHLVNIKKSGGNVSLAQLEEGKQFMDDCRTVIAKFIANEGLRLDSRNNELSKSANYTSVFIVIAALLSLFITLIFYLKIRQAFHRREQLQNSLNKKDQEISRRLNAIQRIAAQIAQGEYDVQIKDAELDDLGSLSGSLNAMAAALQKSFDELNANEWRQTGLAILNERLVGNKSEHALIREALHHLVYYSNSLNGAFYVFEQGKLKLANAYGMENEMFKEFFPGEGIIGQVFLDRKIKRLDNVGQEDYVLRYANGKIQLKQLLFLPISSDDSCTAVIQIGAVDAIKDYQMPFFQEAIQNIGIAIAAARGRDQVQRLLEETQAQTEELQVQHAELENLNAELQTQTHKLQSSEEELRVQQEDLVYYNTELEERSQLLEEKNQLIAARNLEIQRNAEQLALSARYKSEFLANMSHELRTPLNSILLLSQLISENVEGNLNRDQIESAEVIKSSGTSLLGLIDEILDLSKIESGKMELDYQAVRLSEIGKDLHSLFHPQLKEKGLPFELVIQPTLVDQIETDRLRLDQILRNLLANAIKFTKEGSINLHVFQDPAIAENVVFAVSDTGIGIPKDKQALVFEAFQQADGSTQRKYGGTGLGLSISREIARLLGGEITLLSEVGVGSKFSLSIPKSKNGYLVKSRPEEVIDALVTEVQEINEFIEEGAFRAMHPIPIPEEVEDDRHKLQEGDKVILIIEDDTNFARALLKFTNKAGYKGVVVVRGDLAAEYALTYQPIAILLDIQLPIKDGWQVMEEIKGNLKTRHIPVHIMSSWELKKESLLKGAIDFMNKPIAVEHMEQMFQKIEEALHKHPKKVLIVEENAKHAQALAYFLSNFNIISEIKTDIMQSVEALQSDAASCVILDMGIPVNFNYEALEIIKNTSGLESLPIILFTGRNLPQSEERKIKKYADSIVLKTAHSYQRLLDEVGLFLHLVEEKTVDIQKGKGHKLGSLTEVLTGKKVLIADDDVRNIFSLSKAVERYNMEVISATDGTEALEQLTLNKDVSIILMDMMMPEMDGYQAIEQIRKNAEFAELPIIAVTAKAMIGDRDRCIVAGASDYISKPVDNDQLLSLMRVWLYKH